MENIFNEINVLYGNHITDIPLLYISELPPLPIGIHNDVIIL